MEPECIIHLIDPEYGSLVKAAHLRCAFWQTKRLHKPMDATDFPWGFYRHSIQMTVESTGLCYLNA